MATPISAANAYANLARVLDTAGSGNTSAVSPASATSRQHGRRRDGRSVVQRVLKDAIGGVVETGRKSDAQAVAMASGKANVMDVVTAVAETDVAVSTLVSVRDRVIQAYEDIMKMTI